jgi:hypothetical protein
MRVGVQTPYSCDTAYPYLTELLTPIKSIELRIFTEVPATIRTGKSGSLSLGLGTDRHGIGAVPRLKRRTANLNQGPDSWVDSVSGDGAGVTRTGVIVVCDIREPTQRVHRHGSRL